MAIKTRRKGLLSNKGMVILHRTCWLCIDFTTTIERLISVCCVWHLYLGDYDILAQTLAGYQRDKETPQKKKKEKKKGRN